MPTGTSSEAGLKIYWNIPNGTGNTIFMNYAQGGYGGFTFYNRSSSISPTKHLKTKSYTVGLRTETTIASSPGTPNNAQRTGALTAFENES